MFPEIGPKFFFFGNFSFEETNMFWTERLALSLDMKIVRKTSVDRIQDPVLCSCMEIRDAEMASGWKNWAEMKLFHVKNIGRTWKKEECDATLSPRCFAMPEEDFCKAPRNRKLLSLKVEPRKVSFSSSGTKITSSARKKRYTTLPICQTRHDHFFKTCYLLKYTANGYPRFPHGIPTIKGKCPMLFCKIAGQNKRESVCGTFLTFINIVRLSSAAFVT